MTSAKKGVRDGLRQLPSGRWQARLRSADGGWRSIGTFASKTEAKQARVNAQAEAQRGVYIAGRDRRTVSEWAVEWVDSRPLRPSTAKRYRGMIAAHLDETPLGRMALVDVRTSHVQAWVTGRSVLMAPSTLDRVFTFAGSVFKSARQDRVIVWSPCEGVVLPDAPPAKHVLVTVEQVAAIEAEVPERYRALVRLLAVAGLRIGEALALRVDDIDRDAQEIRVYRSLDQKARSAGPTKAPRHSDRDVPVEADLLRVLAAHQLAHPPVRSATLGSLLFSSAHGRPLRYDSFVEKVFKPAAERAGAPGVTPHDLRHFAGSTLLHDGVPPATVAKVLGHSVETLMRTYAHALPSGDDLVRASMARRAADQSPLSVVSSL